MLNTSSQENLINLERTQLSNTATLPKYKLDSYSHNLILWCLQKDPNAEEINSYGNDSNARPEMIIVITNFSWVLS